MTVLTLTDGIVPAERVYSDKRFNRWGRLIRSTDDVDLSRRGGAALTGPWLDWGKAVAMDRNDYLVIAYETGSMRNHSYQYKLLALDPEFSDDPPYYVADADIDSFIAWADVCDVNKAAAKNSRLYSYALYAGLYHLGRLVAAAPERIQMGAARRAMGELTAAERAIILREYALEVEHVPAQ